MSGGKVDRRDQGGGGQSGRAEQICALGRQVYRLDSMRGDEGKPKQGTGEKEEVISQCGFRHKGFVEGDEPEHAEAQRTEGGDGELVNQDGYRTTSIQKLQKSILSSSLLISASTFLIFSIVATVVGTSGKRRLFLISPITDNIDLTPAGLPSTKSKSINSTNR